MQALHHATKDRDARRGSALVVAVGFAVTLLIAGGSLLVQVTHERTTTEQSVANERARDVSASGAQDALAQLGADPNYTGTFGLDLNGQHAEVTVVAWANDGVDNDSSGAIDDAAEKSFVGITSVGTTNVEYDNAGMEIDRGTRAGRSVTQAVVQKIDLDLAVTQAVYVDDPLSSFKFSGTAFLISGNDTNINNTAGPSVPSPGIGVPGDPTNIKNQISKSQLNCVIGAGTNPSVKPVTDVDISNLFSSFASMATVNWNGPDDSYSGDIGNRPELIPVVAHAKGNLKLNGNTKGCGILCVDGDLTVNGSFDFVGLLCVAGRVTFNGGGGNKDLHGGLLTLGEVTGNDIVINGTVQLRYSSEAISILNTKLSGGVALVSWMQR